MHSKAWYRYHPLPWKFNVNDFIVYNSKRKPCIDYTYLKDNSFYRPYDAQAKDIIITCIKEDMAKINRLKYLLRCNGYYFIPNTYIIDSKGIKFHKALGMYYLDLSGGIVTKVYL